jgi:hypothetical protein
MARDPHRHRILRPTTKIHIESWSASEHEREGAGPEPRCERLGSRMEHRYIAQGSNVATQYGQRPVGGATLCREYGGNTAWSAE